MKKIILTFAICFVIFQTAQIMMAQEQTKPAGAAATPAPVAAAPAAPKADPADVASIDSIMKAVYDVISGDAGTRNWDRFRSLFHKDARLIPTFKDKDSGAIMALALSPDDYAKRNDVYFSRNGFFETELARRVETYGNITHVFSTYASFHSKKDEKPFARGINSFQLMFDGKRWWVMTIYWAGETTDTPIPEKYLKNGN
ncbi:MAG TPA: hypothetical protein VGO50_00620 [Pyrinomonadaceae bacterium]|jgi:hypothetical protein|nr:hypothetical protein [Pyrinomonadaceae bacterium]